MPTAPEPAVRSRWCGAAPEQTSVPVPQRMPRPVPQRLPVLVLVWALVPQQARQIAATAARCADPAKWPSPSLAVG